MKSVQCYELFRGIALKNHVFSIISFLHHSLNGLLIIAMVLFPEVFQRLVFFT